VIELQNFGWNILTVSFIATLCFSFWAAWGLYDQVTKIWKNRSGKPASNVWFIYMSGLFAVGAVYGVSIGSIAVTFSCIARGPLHIPILIGLHRFKGFTRLEWVLLFSLMCVVLVMIFLPMKGWFFLAISIIGLIPTLKLPWEIWREKTSGVVSIKLISVYNASTTFWIIYASVIKDYFLLASTSASFLLFAATTVLWIKFRPRLSPLHPVS